MKISRITAARVVKGHSVELRFDDEFVGKLDLSPVLWGPVFEPLKDPNFFSSFRLEDDTIRWPNGADFCPEVLRYWCEVGSVRTPEETDSHFASLPGLLPHSYIPFPPVASS